MLAVLPSMLCSCGLSSSASGAEGVPGSSFVPPVCQVSLSVQTAIQCLSSTILLRLLCRPHKTFKHVFILLLSETGAWGEGSAGPVPAVSAKDLSSIPGTIEKNQVRWSPLLIQTLRRLEMHACTHPCTHTENGFLFLVVLTFNTLKCRFESINFIPLFQTGACQRLQTSAMFKFVVLKQ